MELTYHEHYCSPQRRNQYSVVKERRRGRNGPAFSCLIGSNGYKNTVFLAIKYTLHSIQISAHYDILNLREK